MNQPHYNDDREGCNTEGGKSAPACMTSGAITAICRDNLFGVGCLTHPTYDSNRASCNTESGKNASICMTSDAATVLCAENLFGVGCLTHDNYENQRDVRAKICAATDNQDDSRCASYQSAARANICRRVPFGGACANDTYKSDRVTQAKACAADMDASGCDETYHVDPSTICGLIPFGGECTDDTYKTKRIARARFCTTNMSDLVCNEIVTTAHICSQLPFHSDCTGNDGNDRKRLEFARLCADDNGEDPFCDKGNVTTAHICSQLPFHSTCVGNDDERFERAKRCVRTPSDSLCDTNDVTPENICSQLPFRSGCTGNASVKLARANRCVLIPEDSRCHSDYVSTDDICSQLPFNAICEGLEDQRLDRAELCVANDDDNGGEPNPLCNKQYVSTEHICSQLPYHSTCSDTRYEHYRTGRITFCNSESNKGNRRCTPTEVVDAVCSDNLFGRGCVNSPDPDGVYADKRTDRIRICNEAGGVSNDDCKPADVVAAICAANLFGTGCVNGADPDGVYAGERTARITFCNKEGNEDNPQCTPADVVDAVCNDNLFGRGCVSSDDPDGVYAGKRATELNFCIANPGKSGCTGTQQDDICSYAPFASFCSNNDASAGKRTERITLCNNEGNEGNYRCTPTEVVAAICDDNPFRTSCVNRLDPDGSYARQRTERLDFCSANPENSDCTGTQRDDICSYAPFASVCSNHAASEGKRTERITLCNNEGNEDNPLCTPTEVVAAVCEDNLFGAGCVNGDDPNGSYAGERINHLNFCSTNSEDSGCTGTKQDDICSYAPFSPVCSNHAASEGKRTESEFNACRKPGPNNPACHGIRQISEKADAAALEDVSITFENRNGTLTSITSLNLRHSRYRANQFVKGLQEDSDVSHLPIRNKTPFTVLTLADSLVGSSQTLGGESEDGVAFFGLKVAHGRFSFYAGVLSGTDLGAPITRTSGTAGTWSGVFQAIGGKGRAIKRNFDLTVDFTDDTTGTIEAFVKAKNDEHYHLTGTFNSVGVISGTVDYGLFTGNNRGEPTGNRLPGQLTGLIGEDGAVGAFIADMDAPYGVNFYSKGFYSGGFVAVPSHIVVVPSHIVEYADWVDITNPSTTRRTTRLTNQFLTGSDATGTWPIPVTITFKNASYGGTSFDGDGNDGVQLFVNTTYGDGPSTNIYAGILTTTNLGAPLNATTASAVWEGRLFAEPAGGVIGLGGRRYSDFEVADFRPTINFNASTISATITGVTRDNGTALANPVSYDFSANFDTHGVFQGTIDRSIAGVKSAGKLTGLIGQEGAVGAFISNPGTPVSYGGGFVARPTR